jgi:hypothetical protein
MPAPVGEDDVLQMFWPNIGQSLGSERHSGCATAGAGSLASGAAEIASLCDPPASFWGALASPPLAESPLLQAGTAPAKVVRQAATSAATPRRPAKREYTFDSRRFEFMTDLSGSPGFEDQLSPEAARDELMFD